MAISGKIVSLKDGQDLNIFPETAASAVYLENGKTLEESVITYKESEESIILNTPDLVKKINDIETGLGTVNSQLEQNVQMELENNNVQRKFRPTLGLFLDLNPSGGEMIDEQTIITNIQRAKENGIESIVIQPWVVWNRETKVLSFKNDIDRTKLIVSTALSNGLKVSALKIHMYMINLNTVVSDGDMENFKAQYKNLVFNFVNSFKGMDIGCVIAFNESAILYRKGSIYIDFVNEVITKLKETNFPITISTMGAKECVQIDTSIKTNVDLFCINSYPKISYKKERTTLLDSVSAWNNSYEYKCYLEIKRQYPFKKLIMSETGCNDYWLCLTNPGDWTLSETGTTNGYAPAIMLEGLYNSNFNSLIDEVWWCYFNTILNNKCKEINLRYLGGVKNEL